MTTSMLAVLVLNCDQNFRFIRIVVGICAFTDSGDEQSNVQAP